MSNMKNIHFRKKLMIGISITAVILLTLTSFSNVIGYQTVQNSQQNIINERINQRELLFQTIVDIANNKEIQRIILKSQLSRGIFPTTEFPVVTKNQLKQMYVIGLVLSKVISKSRIQSMIGEYQFNNQEMQKEISSVIEKDTTLNTKIIQLSTSGCDCSNNLAVASWSFPVICFILLIFALCGILLWLIFDEFPNGGYLGNIFYIFFVFAIIFRCNWAGY